MATGSSGMMRRLLKLPGQIVVLLYVVVDGVVAPLFRPLTRWLSALRIVQAIERGIGTLPPYVILVLLVIPFAVAELAKAYAVFLIGSGHFEIGVALFIAAYVVSILVCERIFSAGKAQLMTIGWFARLFTSVMAYKDRILAWFRTTALWRRAAAFKEKARSVLVRIRDRTAATLAGKPGGLFGR